MVKIGSSTLSMKGDRLKARDVVKSLGKVVEISNKLFSMISYLHQY